MTGELNIDVHSVWFNAYSPDEIMMYFGLGGVAIGMKLDEIMLRDMKHSIDKVIKFIDEEKNEERII